MLDDHGRVDILVNNAGRSIRRAISASYDRFHDFERTMQLNYFGALRLIMGVLPGMAERHRGHIINISSIGVLTNSPRFSAYVASKAALDAFSRCAQAEYSDNGVNFTTINMPLVKTPMIAPTKMYESVPTLTAGGSSRHHRRSDHRAAGAYRDAARHVRADLLRARAARVRDRHEYRIPAVPGFVGVKGHEGPRGTRRADQRADRVCVADARRALVG